MLNFDVTGDGLMETILCMQVEQSDGNIRFHLGKCMQGVLEEYTAFSSSSMKRVPSQAIAGSCLIVQEAKKTEISSLNSTGKEAT